MSSSDTSSYQSGDPRKYEHPPSSPTPSQLEEKLQEELDMLLTNSPRSNMLGEIITRLRTEIHELGQRIMELNTTEMQMDHAIWRLNARVAELEAENKALHSQANFRNHVIVHISAFGAGVILGISAFSICNRACRHG